FFSNHPTLKKAITTGFLGALTTFSTFQLELIHMFDHQQFITLLLYAVTSYVLGILLCYVGIKLGGGLS
ncbi:camphor resistance protein CrcB, partial [Staphylococcus aureus]